MENLSKYREDANQFWLLPTHPILDIDIVLYLIPNSATSNFLIQALQILVEHQFASRAIWKKYSYQATISTPSKNCGDVNLAFLGLSVLSGADIYMLIFS